jgi:hypothetical protein
MIQSMLRAITEQYHLNAISPGEFSRLKISGMNFQIWAFHAEGLGHVSAMTATGFFGLMRMDTLIINPTERDLPLFSYDRVHAMGSDTLIFELYDTTTAPAPLQRLRDLPGKTCIAVTHKTAPMEQCDWILEVGESGCTLRNNK